MMIINQVGHQIRWTILRPIYADFGFVCIFCCMCQFPTVKRNDLYNMQVHELRDLHSLQSLITHSSHDLTALSTQYFEVFLNKTLLFILLLSYDVKHQEEDIGAWFINTHSWRFFRIYFWQILLQLVRRSFPDGIIPSLSSNLFWCQARTQNDAVWNAEYD